MGIIQEFKEFAVKGNAVDMAVGIIVGASFNRVVSSLVNDVIMPPLGVLIGGVDFKNLTLKLADATKDSLGNEIPAQTLRYGLFINNLIDFLIMTFTVFVVIKFMNKMMSSTGIPGLSKKPAP
jgi:large conductance mechanosensitive channel